MNRNSPPAVIPHDQDRADRQSFAGVRYVTTDKTNGLSAACEDGEQRFEGGLPAGMIRMHEQGSAAVAIAEPQSEIYQSMRLNRALGLGGLAACGGGIASLLGVARVDFRHFHIQLLLNFLHALDERRDLLA